jgi:hypothetical protein
MRNGGRREGVIIGGRREGVIIECREWRDQGNEKWREEGRSEHRM